jgi:hypothetical protein
MSAEDSLRLAWQAARDGRMGMRDALLTLAVAEKGPAEARWAARCWNLLVTTRADHLFARFATREQALADPRVAERLRLLRAVYPPTRVERLLDRAAMLRGTYTGRRVSLPVVIEELFGPQGPRRERSASTTQKAPGLPLESRPPLLKRPGPAPTSPQVTSDRRESAERDEALPAFYLAVLLAIAMLLATTLKASDRESKAA